MDMSGSSKLPPIQRESTRFGFHGVFDYKEILHHSLNDLRYIISYKIGGKKGDG